MRYEITLTDSSGNDTINTTTELYMEFTDLNAFTQYSVIVKSINNENKEASSKSETYNTTELGESISLTSRVNKPCAELTVSAFSISLRPMSEHDIASICVTVLSH